MKVRQVVALAVGFSAGLSVAGRGAGSARADQLALGFSQEGAESGWRAANTLSIQQAAKDAGVDLKFSDSQGLQQNQLKALDAFAQQQVDVVALSPKEESGWEPILKKLKAAQIPVICSDRNVKVSDPSLQPTFIGSDLKEEGKRAGAWLAKRTGGTCNVVRLEGNVGGSATLDRTHGFDEAIAAFPGMKLVASKPADFQRDKGKSVMEAILKSPEGANVNAVFAENDDMALGAIQAIEEAGKKPGTDVVVVSIDGIRDALQSIIDGKLSCTIECNPLLGPAIMETAKKLKAGEAVPARVISVEALFDDPAQVKAVIGSRKY